MIRRKLVDDKGKISTVNALLGSSAAGVVAASMSTPLDVIKTRLQVPATPSRPPSYPAYHPTA